jgi:hypothetical protein
MNAQAAPDQSVTDTPQRRTDFTNLIDGEPVTGSEWFDVINPATGARIARRRRPCRLAVGRNPAWVASTPRVISVLKH